jgi:hypothetical protein
MDREAGEKEFLMQKATRKVFVLLQSSLTAFSEDENV